ncbi:retrovirus-related pol polyprotein from transposon TNT 1-94 [Tanacetum coccineum]
MYVKLIQELLGYVRDTCPDIHKPSEKLVAVTPINKKKIVRFADTVTSLGNIPKVTNIPLLSSTGVNPSTSASGSKPSGNVKNDRILQTPSSNEKNKHLGKGAQALCSVYLFNANHAMCLIDYVNSMNVRAKSVSKKNKKRKEWKPTRKVFNSIGYKWKPTMEPGTSRGSDTSFAPSSSSLIDSRLSKLFCDLKVAFRKHTCFVRNLKGVDLLSGSRGTNLYSLSIEDMMASSLICLLHGLVRGLPRLKFEKGYLCSACAMGKSKKQSHKPKSEDTNQEKLYLLHMNLCGPMHVASINGKKYILVIVDDYSRFTWVKFLSSKDEAPDFIIKFMKMIQVRLKATVRNIHTDNETEFVNPTLRDYYEQVGISYETPVVRTPQQNGVVERRNHTLVEAARTMLIFPQAPLFLWAEAIATACYTQNRSIIR